MRARTFSPAPGQSGWYADSGGRTRGYSAQGFIVRGLQSQFKAHLVAARSLYSHVLLLTAGRNPDAYRRASPTILADRLLIRGTQHLHFRRCGGAAGNRPNGV